MAFRVGLFLAFLQCVSLVSMGFFSLSETMVVTLFLHYFCKTTKLYIYF